MGYLVLLLWVALLVYCLVDVAQADEARIRSLPKVAWLVLVVLVPLAGGIAWLVAGRPVRPERTGRSSATRWPGSRRPGPTAPDDDPEFLADLARANARREQERQRREREAHEEQPPEPEP